MANKHDRNVSYRLLLHAGMLICSVAIQGYYWNAETFESIHELPGWVMILALLYVVQNTIKKRLSPGFQWVELLSYAGLLAMILPVLQTDGTAEYWAWVTDLGTLLLVMPVLIEGKKTLNERKQQLQ